MIVGCSDNTNVNNSEISDDTVVIENSVNNVEENTDDVTDYLKENNLNLQSEIIDDLSIVEEPIINTEVMNPILNYNSIEEASEKVGFTLKELNLSDFELSEISVITTSNTNTLELLYRSENSKICVRKTDNPMNNSGNYLDYSNIVTESMDGEETNILYYGN